MNAHETRDGGPLRIDYLANIRLPTEKAHGLQIMQMAEAFAQADPQARLTLYAARRFNTPALRGKDPFTFYGVDPAFTIRRVPCVDMHPLSAGRFERLAFGVEAATYTLVVVLWMLLSPGKGRRIIYSRDPLTLFMLSLMRPRAKLVYEVHQLSHSRAGTALQRRVCRRVDLVVAVTGMLGERMRDAGARQVLVAPDGYRAKRFAGAPDQKTARAGLPIAPDAFVVGYIGRLHTMGMAKGVDTLIEGIVRCGQRSIPITLLLVGGPQEWAERYRAQWLAGGLPADRFVSIDSVPSGDVPRYMAAADVLTLPQPWTEHFAYYASPLRLFEYMATGRTILATNLPSTVEILRDGESALLFEPEAAQSAADALARLYADRALVDRLAQQAKAESTQYEWTSRAERILRAVTNG